MALEEEHDDKQPDNAIEAPQSLPTDIVIEILLKLPVESLLRCKSVCKLWCSLVSDPRFVTSHLNLRAHRRLIINVDCPSNDFNTTCGLDDIDFMDDDDFMNNALEVDYPLKNTSTYVNVVGSCNGLVCLCIQFLTCDRQDHILVIWNPSTRKYNTLPLDGYTSYEWPLVLGFGYDDSTDDYKVVSIQNNDRIKYKLLVEMYSLRNGCWKDIEAFPYRVPFNIFGEFSNGALHWLAEMSDGDWTIVSLDLATETFGKVMLPVYEEGERRFWLGCLGEWLCVVCDFDQLRVNLWAMKVYGVEDSWTKLFSVSYTPPNPESEISLEPLCILNDGRILLTSETKLMIYDSKNDSLSDVKNFCDYFEASIFVESLVSPKILSEIPARTARKKTYRCSSSH